MKKYFAIAMIALAALCASSCNKDNSKNEDKQGLTYCKAWVTEEESATEAAGDLIMADESAEAMEELEEALKDIKLRRTIFFSDNGTGYSGILVNKARLNELADAISQWASSSRYLRESSKSEFQEIAIAMKLSFNTLTDNDVLGSEFTYTATPTDQTSGHFMFRTETDDSGIRGEKTLDVEYKGFTDSTLTLVYSPELEVSFISAASLGITVGKLVDGSSVE